MIIAKGVEAQLPKFERGHCDGTVSTRISKEEWGPRSPGHILVLGKEFRLASATKGDSPQRIAEAKVLLRGILYQASQNKQDVFESSLRRAMGIWIFITDGCVFLRSHLRGAISKYRLPAYICRVSVWSCVTA